MGNCLYQVRNVLFFSCSVDWKLRWLSFLSVLSVFVDFPFWMRLGVRYHCYYLYSVVCQQIWLNVLPLFFPRYTGVKKTQHYKLFISNPIVLFWRTKKKPLVQLIVNQHCLHNWWPPFCFQTSVKKLRYPVLCLF
jgi:hypothetical protein